MPEFWQFPTVSMGLGPLGAIYQAKFLKYLNHRGLKDTAAQRVYAFLGDGEMDEPESKGAITIATRDKLDNLCFVINCNLQRLDGPVTGNGKIINELEGIFAGAGWNVIKVIWGSRWDALLRKDTSGKLIQLMNETWTVTIRPSSQRMVPMCVNTSLAAIRKPRRWSRTCLTMRSGR